MAMRRYWPPSRPRIRLVDFSLSEVEYLKLANREGRSRRRRSIRANFRMMFHPSPGTFKVLDRTVDLMMALEGPGELPKLGSFLRLIIRAGFQEENAVLCRRKQSRNCRAPKL